MPAAVVILAAGSGTRVGADLNKVLLPLAGRPMLAWSIRAASAARGVGYVVLVCRPGEEDEVGAALAPYLDPELGSGELRLVTGGHSRHASERAALDVLAPEVSSGAVEVIAIHDGARPLADPGFFEQVIEDAARYGSAVPTVSLTGLIHRDGRRPASRLVGVQTPQAFSASELLTAYDRAEQDGFEGTDTAACFTKYCDRPVIAVRGRRDNLKITYAEDLAVAKALLARGGWS